MPDNVYHPNHYVINSLKIEPIELTGRMDSCVGQALNYVLRARFKGKFDEDIEKAINYLKIQLEMHDMFDNMSRLFCYETEKNQCYKTLMRVWRDFYKAPPANEYGKPFEDAFLLALITPNYNITIASIEKALEILEDVRDDVLEV